MRLYYCDQFELPLPAGHRFPMSKYRRLRDRLVSDPAFANDLFLVPPAVSDEQLRLAHDADYVHRVVHGCLSEAEQKRIGFPWSEQMVERSRRSSGATLEAARSALQEGVAVNLAGGTHHAMRDAGEGYCVFNDAAVTICVLLASQSIRSALVIDCDVHQGNGTAHILASNPAVFTFSMHGAKNFPLRKFPSSLDIDIPDGTEDPEYLALLECALQTILDGRHFDLAIYLAGADPYCHDRLGRLQLTKDGLRERDSIVLTKLSQARIPCAIAMAGGYAENVEDIIDIHAATIRVASESCRRWQGDRSWQPPTTSSLNNA